MLGVSDQPVPLLLKCRVMGSQFDLLRNKCCSRLDYLGTAGKRMHLISLSFGHYVSVAWTQELGNRLDHTRVSPLL